MLLEQIQRIRAISYNSLFLPILRALRTIPFPLRFRCQSDAREMEPFYRTLEQRRERSENDLRENNKAIVRRATYVRIIATDHFPVRHLVAQTISRLVRIHRHVQDVRRMAKRCGVNLHPASNSSGRRGRCNGSP